MVEVLFPALDVALKELRKRPRARIWLLGISITISFVAASIATYIKLKIPDDSASKNFLLGFPTVSLIISGLMFVLSLASFLPASLLSLEERDLDELRKEREELRTRLTKEEKDPEERPADVLDTIRLNLNQLTEYYTINKGQARNSFRASMGAMIAGLATILVGIWMVYANPTGELKVPILSAGAGTLMEFIAGAYFYLYNRSLTQLNYFFDKLTTVQDTMLAIKLCENLPEPNATNAKERVIMLLMTSSRPVAPQYLESLTKPVRKTALRKKPIPSDAPKQDGSSTSTN